MSANGEKEIAGETQTQIIIRTIFGINKTQNRQIRHKHKERDEHFLRGIASISETLGVDLYWVECLDVHVYTVFIRHF